jgi:glutathione S-transferase
MASTPLRIYGRKNSFNVQKVLWCCAEIGLPFERIDRGGEFGGTAVPEYRAMNPTGRVPTIDDNGFILWESNTIVRYLAVRHSMGRLCPEDDQARARAEQWMDWQLAHLWPALVPAFMGLVRTPPEKRNNEAISSAVRLSAEQFTLLDAHLRKHDYVNGSDFTMADIPLGAVAHRWFALDIERPTLGGVDAWFERIKQRPGFVKHVDIPLS